MTTLQSFSADTIFRLTNLDWLGILDIVLVTAVLGVGIALPLSVIGHEGSTVLVSLNVLRLLRYEEPKRSI